LLAGKLAAQLGIGRRALCTISFLEIMLLLTPLMDFYVSSIVLAWEKKGFHNQSSSFWFFPFLVNFLLSRIQL